jgi:hypothetical protein
MLGGLFIWFSRWDRRTSQSLGPIYATRAVALFRLQLLVVYEVAILNRWMALDFGANVAMLGLSLWGWRVMGRERPSLLH